MVEADFFAGPSQLRACILYFFGHKPSGGHPGFLRAATLQPVDCGIWTFQLLFCAVLLATDSGFVWPSTHGLLGHFVHRAAR